MRLIVGRSPKEELEKVCGVRLNGVPIKCGRAADDQLGIVFFYEHDADGKPMLFDRNGNPWIVRYHKYTDGELVEEDYPVFRTRLAHGKVEFIFKENRVNFDDSNQPMVWRNKKDVDDLPYTHLLVLMKDEAEYEGYEPFDFNFAGNPNIYYRGIFNQENNELVGEGYAMFVKKKEQIAGGSGGISVTIPGDVAKKYGWVKDES